MHLFASLGYSARRYIVVPSLIVSRTLMSPIVIGSTVRGSFSMMTKSASFPASIVPLRGGEVELVFPNRLSVDDDREKIGARPVLTLGLDGFDEDIHRGVAVAVGQDLDIPASSQLRIHWRTCLSVMLG